MTQYISCAKIIPSLNKWPLKIFALILDKFFALDWLNKELTVLMKKYNNDIITAGAKFVEHLDIKIVFDREYVIPATGPLQIVSTHGWEFLDVIFLLAIITPIRSDVKFIADRALSTIKIFDEYCFYTSKKDSPISKYQKLAHYLAGGHALCHFSLAWEQSSMKKNQSSKIKYNKPLTPLAYNLHQDAAVNILPINLRFRKTFFRHIFVHIEKSLLRLEYVKTVYCLGGFYGLLSFRILRSMKGQTIMATVGDVVTASPPKLSRPEATKWLAKLLGLAIIKKP